MSYYLTVPFPVASITVMEENGYILGIRFKADTGNAIKKKTPVISKAFRQLSDYFDGELKAFDLPVRPAGSAFQLAVWEALRTIPYGETRSYGDIARQIGNPKASRAVGMANHHNPVSIVIPCHRVIGADGSLTGYGGGLPVKQQLLEMESHYSGNQHTSLF